MQVLHQSQVTPAPRKATFLLRSASVVSLVAWKARFESYAGKFTKEPSFVSYTTNENGVNDLKIKGHDAKCKFANELGYIEEGFNAGPENDLPPDYIEATAETPPPPHPEEENENQFFRQDFTALENYLKKKLSIKKEKGSKAESQETSTEKVFQWLHELPEGNNLEEFLEAYGIPTKGVNLEDLKDKLGIFLQEKLAFDQQHNDVNVDNEGQGEEKPTASRWQQQISDLKELVEEDNLEKWIESLDVPYFRPIPETKEEIRKYLKLQLDETVARGPPEPPPKPSFVPETPELKEISALVPQWKELIEKMRNLKNEEELDKWLDSLEVPCNIAKEKVKADIKKFFVHEEFENFAGKSIIFQEHSLAKKLWDKFEDASVLKQVAMVAGTTAVLGLIAVLSTTMLSFAFPAAGAAVALNPFFTEVFAQYFLQRQEVAFNLLNCHAQNAKPLSTAWAKQYVLWKYC